MSLLNGKCIGLLLPSGTWDLASLWLTGLHCPEPGTQSGAAPTPCPPAITGYVMGCVIPELLSRGNLMVEPELT